MHAPRTRIGLCFVPSFCDAFGRRQLSLCASGVGSVRPCARPRGLRKCLMITGPNVVRLETLTSHKISHFTQAGPCGIHVSRSYHSASRGCALACMLADLWQCSRATSCTFCSMTCAPTMALAVMHRLQVIPQTWTNCHKLVSNLSWRFPKSRSVFLRAHHS